MTHATDSAATPAATERTAAGGRVLVFIVAYQAARHLAAVLDRIPSALYHQPGTDILVIDDESPDDGAAIGAAWAEKRGVRNVTVLRNRVNQGYGGNQKLGYRIAIEAGYDFVILLHGDGQYAPELLPQFIDTWRTTRADVVLGSRMTSLRSARRGRMPLYKLVGNRVLTTFQNAVTHQSLSEYHTGYRGYATSFLARVPFELNTNEFHFDTEILLQAFHVGARVREFPIPTFYGDEISRVQGLRYARDVVRATLRWRLHQVGMLVDLKYPRAVGSEAEARRQLSYPARALAVREVARAHPARLLDIGCGPGYVARQCTALGVEVTGVDATPPLDGSMAHFRQADLQACETPPDAFDFDMILLLEVLERLREPEQFLLQLRNRSAVVDPTRRPPTVLLSTPNVAFIAVRLNLLLGRFNYAQRGILDIAHTRLFTQATLCAMLRQCGYDVERVQPCAVPFEAVMPGRLGRALAAGSRVAAAVWPRLFAFQFMVTCRPRPGVMQLIQGSEAHRVLDPVLQALLEATDTEIPRRRAEGPAVDR